MLLTTEVRNKTDDLEAFSRRFAKKWKNYFSLDGLLPDIEPTLEQKQVVQSNEKQLIIRGSAGSGKSLMLAYRLIKVMEQNEKPQRILYVTFNDTLIQDTVKRLYQSESYRTLSKRHLVEIKTYHDLVRGILMNDCGYPKIRKLRMTQEEVESHESLIEARLQVVLTLFNESDAFYHMERLFKTHTAHFLREEFFWMKANGVITKEKYFNKERTGRGSSPSVNRKQRPTIFYLFEKYNEFMERNFPKPEFDMEDYALHLLNQLNAYPRAPYKYDHILVDEFQDLQPMQIKSLVELTNNSITLVGDDKQRIYKRTPVSYRELNLHITARKNQKLTKNFRSTQQIMNLASAIQFDDVENIREDDQEFFREGEKPQIMQYTSNKKMLSAMIKRIKHLQQEDSEKTIAVIHRFTKNEVRQDGNLRQKLHREFNVISVDQYGQKYHYDSHKKPIFFTDPFEIKGLEFDYVFITHFDREHYPSSIRIGELDEKYGGAKWIDNNYNNDYDAILNDEKKILYVACSRARQELNIYYVAEEQKKISPFIREFHGQEYKSNFKKTQYKD